MQRITRNPNERRYWIDGDCEGLKSSTGFIHQFFAEFDADRIIGYILKGRRWGSDPEYKYYLMARQAIKDSWEANGNAASAAGTIMHAAIEYHYNGLPVSEEQRNTPEWAMFGEPVSRVASVASLASLTLTSLANTAFSRTIVT